MSAVRLTILGAGSVRCTPPVIATLATFFGERPLEITMYDADEERLDLFDRFARLCFSGNENGHSLRSTVEPVEAMEGADKLIVQVGENCARKLLGSLPADPDPTDAALDHLLLLCPDHAEVASLLGSKVLPHVGQYLALDWPPEPTVQERTSIPHQVLRFLNGEEFVHTLLKQNLYSPLKPWLNQPVKS